MFSDLTQIQISGLIALLVSTPFLIKSVRNFYFASASKQWPKISGTIKEISSFGRKYSLQYEYTVNRDTYKNHKICFTNTNAPIDEEFGEFEKKYTIHQIINVFYNPIKPEQAVLEPGRKDGLLITIIIFSVLFIFGCLAFFDQGLFSQLIGSF